MNASHAVRGPRFAGADPILGARVGRLVGDAAPAPERIVLYADAPEAQIAEMVAVIDAATAVRPQRPTCTLVVAASAQRHPAVGAWETVTCEALPSVCLQSPFTDRGVAVPRLLLEPSLWITATRLSADRHYGVRTPLALHAELLRAHNPRLPRPLLAAQAHRLAPPDLCCTYVPVAGGAGALLLHGDLLAAELALAEVIGVRAAALPHLRRVARHFALPTLTAADRPTPDLAQPRVHLASVLIRARMELLAHRLRAGLGDVGRAAANLRRAPAFLRRRVLALREARG
jgi:hypothetical protein